MTVPARPDPDALLARVREEESRAASGRLKIFLGASPGVGKTFAMLEAAQASHAAGVDVLVGVVETHGRAETAKLLEGLDRLPLKSLTHRGIVLTEFDLDAALARHPTLILVDELAHTNAPGSRHAKRWQDVEELIGAGINVYTTLNVQHVESLNDVVAQITGVTVQETVPDAVLDEAAEMELVDVSPDVLLQRLREGKVYLPEQAQRALDRFFKRGNLIALRELALRRTAQSVDAEMLDWRTAAGIEGAWPAGERVLVAVAATPDASRLVRAGWRMATSLRAECIVLHVETPAVRRLTAKAMEPVHEALRLATELGARVVTVTGVDVGGELLAWARRENVTRMVVGRSHRTGWFRRIRPSPVDRLLQGSGGVDLHLLASRPEAVAPINLDPTTAVEPLKVSEFATALAWVAGAALLGLLVRSRISISTTDVAMLFLLAVAVAGARSRPWPGLVAAVVSIAVFDFVFVKPYYTFAVSDVSYLLTFIVMLGVAIVMSRLTSFLREQTVASRTRERRTAALLDLAEELAVASDAATVAKTVQRRLADSVGVQAAVLLVGDDGNLHSAVPTVIPLDEKELAVARWVHDHGTPAGSGTATLQAAAARWIPLSVGGHSVGALGVLAERADAFAEEDRRHLVEAVAGQAAVSLERLRLADRGQRDRIEIEAERLRTALLSSLSHDLRTPLAAVEGAASTLLKDEASLPTATRRDLLEVILEEGRRMGRLVRNLLEMVRMESGMLQVRYQWESLEEVIGLGLLRMGDALTPFTIATHLAPGLPLIRADGLLLEQVVVNLLENAAKFAPAGSTIDISVREVRNNLELTIADRGPGVPPGEEERIFDKFYRAPNAQGEGVGLGLAICRGIVTGHGGRIWAESRDGGGLNIIVTLPVPDHQPAPIPEAAE